MLVPPINHQLFGALIDIFYVSQYLEWLAGGSGCFWDGYLYISQSNRFTSDIQLPTIKLVASSIQRSINHLTMNDPPGERLASSARSGRSRFRSAAHGDGKVWMSLVIPGVFFLCIISHNIMVNN